MCAPGPRRKEQCPHKILIQTCPGMSRSLQQRHGSWWPVAGLGSLSVAVHSWVLLKKVTIIFITSTIVWPQVNSKEGTQLHPSTESWIKNLLSMARPIRTRPSFPLSQSLPSGSFHKCLYPSPSESRQNENHNHRKLTNLITWTTALSNSMNL